MKKMVIGLLQSGTNNIYQIPPYFHRSGVEVMVHHNPNLTLLGSEFKVNADIVAGFFNPGAVEDVYFRSAMGDNYHHIQRFKKSEQVAKLIAYQNKHFVEDSDLSLLEVPQTLSASTSAHSGQWARSAIDHLGGSFGEQTTHIDRVVVKPENGARGLGQATIPIDQLRYFFEHVTKKTPYGKLKDMFPDAHFSGVERGPNTEEKEDDELPLSLHDEWMVSEYVNEIVSEYRLVVGGDKVYCEERQRTEGNYQHANLDLDKGIKTGSYQVLNPTSHFHNLAMSISAAFDMPLGSIDLYERANGTLGFLECCPQFGMWSMPHEIAYDIHMAFLDYLIARYEENHRIDGNISLRAEEEEK